MLSNYVNMCVNNTLNRICNVPLADYVAKKSLLKQGRYPQVVFCDTILGKVINALLRQDSLSSASTHSPDIASLAKAITGSQQEFWGLAQDCILKHAGAGKDYMDIVATTFKKLVKYQCGLAGDHGLLIWDEGSGKWTENKMLHFDSDEHVGRWLAHRQKQKERSSLANKTPPRFIIGGVPRSDATERRPTPVQENPSPGQQNERVHGWVRMLPQDDNVQKLESMALEYQDRMEDMLAFNKKQAEIWSRI
ncbi:hypothetical protein BKA59DRAFT_556371 [Fusarium tricinctum]|uniref:Uncharacterized protein n=1 Tax=Fusarium tricinctum TaxID=61284 RepID=A0A8K0RUD2_9HYPO|nr:hypothetical protein BKA59DRAFT_556371 [Fusarium tricinctum]